MFLLSCFLEFADPLTLGVSDPMVCNFTGPLTHDVFHDDSNLYIFIHASIASTQIFFSDCFYLGSEICTDIWNFDHLFFDISTCRFRFEITDNPFFVQRSFFQLGIDFQLETFWCNAITCRLRNCLCMRCSGFSLCSHWIKLARSNFWHCDIQLGDWFYIVHCLIDSILHDGISIYPLRHWS